MGSRSGALIALAVAASAVAAPDRFVTATVSPRSARPGDLVVVTIDAPGETNANPKVFVKAFGRAVPSFASARHQWQALIGVDLDVKPGTYKVNAVVEDTGGEHDLVVVPRTFPTRRLTVDPDFVTPPPSEEKRIEAEAKLLERTWASTTAERLWTTPFTAPVPQASNSAFGTRSIFNGKPRSPHGGADFLSPAGTPVAAPNGGRVVIARNLYYSGNTVVIDHGLGFFSMLAHLSAIDVKEGDTIAPRQRVGLVGATGRVTGPHLHWAVRVAGARVDPLSVLTLLGKS